MILHCVFCHFRADVKAATRTGILGELAEFSGTLDGVIDFKFGPNRDFEKKSQAYSDGFVVRFATQAALEAYAAHPQHKVLGQQLCDMCEGGADGITVFDIEAS